MFGRKGLFGNRQPKRVPFEPEGSARIVRNAVPRGEGPVPLDAIVDAVRRSEREFGRDSLTNLERWIRESSELEAYVIHQGGFDYYLAHVEDAARWADAAAALYAIGKEEAAAMMRKAVELFTTFDKCSDQSAMQSYLNQMREIDRQFGQLVPNLEGELAAFADQHYPYADRA